MSPGFRIACLQMQTGNELQANLAAVRDMAREAAAGGAQFILTPEYVLMMDGSGRVMRERALEPDGSPALAELQSLGRELRVWLLAGSLTLRTEDGRMANRSCLISGDGEVVATYDKIHMFDAMLPDGRAIRESSAYRPLYRALAHAGAQFIRGSSAPRSTRLQSRARHDPVHRARSSVQSAVIAIIDRVKRSAFVFSP